MFSIGTYASHSCGAFGGRLCLSFERYKFGTAHQSRSSVQIAPNGSDDSTVPRLLGQVQRQDPQKPQYRMEEILRVMRFCPLQRVYGRSLRGFNYPSCTSVL